VETFGMRNKIIIILLLLFISVQLSAQQKSNSNLLFEFRAGLNVSRPISIPEDISKNSNPDVCHIPALNWGMLVKYTKNNLCFSSGLGLKNLKFNFERDLTGSISDRSNILIRMNYLYLPFRIDFYVDQSKTFFVTFCGEYNWLIEDVNFEVFYNRRFDRINENSRSVYYWFKQNSLFFFVGFGKQIKHNTLIAFDLGFTPSNTGINQEILEGDYYGTNFNFSKRLLELRISLLYNFYKINL
jgi:hypothetical protein